MTSRERWERERRAEQWRRFDQACQVVAVVLGAALPMAWVVWMGQP